MKKTRGATRIAARTAKAKNPYWKVIAAKNGISATSMYVQEKRPRVVGELVTDGEDNLSDGRHLYIIDGIDETGKWAEVRAAITNIRKELAFCLTDPRPIIGWSTGLNKRINWMRRMRQDEYSIAHKGFFGDQGNDIANAMLILHRLGMVSRNQVMEAFGIGPEDLINDI